MPKSSVSRSNSPPPRRQASNRSPQRNESPKRRSPRQAEAQETSGEPKVYVSGLPANIKKEDLEETFSKFGNVADLFVINKDSFSFAFVLYNQHREAQAAINELSGTRIEGKSIKCEIAKPRPPRGENGAGRGRGSSRGGPQGDGGNRGGRGCFKCGEEGHFARQCPNPGEGKNDRDNNRGPRRFNDNRSKQKSDDERTDSPKKRPQRNRSRSNSSTPQKKRQSPRSPVKRRKSVSSSGSVVKGRTKRSRSRSVQLRSGKRRVSRSSSSRR